MQGNVNVILGRKTFVISAFIDGPLCETDILKTQQQVRPRMVEWLVERVIWLGLGVFFPVYLQAKKSTKRWRLPRVKKKLFFEETILSYLSAFLFENLKI